MRTCLALTVVLALTVPALAQQGRGRGMGFGMGPGQLLTNKSVQEELKMTEDQVTKAKEFGDKQREAMKGLFGQDVTPEERKEKMAELNKQAEQFAKDTLKEDQTKRLKQIQLQVGGVMSPQAQQELGVSDDQKEKFREIGTQMREQMKELFSGGGGFNDPETQKKVAALRKESSEKAIGVLTAEQKKKWEELTGKPFEIKMEGFGPGGDTPKKKKKKDKDGV